MANKGCWKWAIVGGVIAVLVFATAMIVGFLLQKHTILPGRSPQPCYLVFFPFIEGGLPSFCHALGSLEGQARVSDKNRLDLPEECEFSFYPR